jgi:hypothetical protein
MVRYQFACEQKILIIKTWGDEAHEDELWTENGSDLHDENGVKT